MSINLDVLGELEDLGVASCDDIAPLLPEYTRDQIKQSLQNLRYMGRVRVAVASTGRGAGGGKTVARYALAQREEAQEPAVIYRPYSSVWDMGTRALETA
jgi:hypothetical protein